MVHVPSQCLHRQNVVTVMTLAKVSMTLPLQNGHAVGRVTGLLRCGSNMGINAPRVSTADLFNCAQ
jgi:hypothetical protein